jgi:hypothetical protein
LVHYGREDGRLSEEPHDRIIERISDTAIAPQAKADGLDLWLLSRMYP